MVVLRWCSLCGYLKFYGELRFSRLGLIVLYVVHVLAFGFDCFCGFFAYNSAFVLVLVFRVLMVGCCLVFYVGCMGLCVEVPCRAACGFVVKCICGL